ncbi:Twinfilin-1 [Rhizina undulata]
MQSGISASEELLAAFQSFVTDESLRGLLVTISKESLVPDQTIPIIGTFEEDLPQLDPLIKDNVPVYVLLRRHSDSAAPFVAITYVPDTAHVRQKMLFASTRNTLLRELGTEKFGESIFSTMKKELTAEGFKKHDAHGAKPAPLTEEEQMLKEVREAEAAASTGTAARKAHVSSGVSFPVSEEALQALENLKDKSFINLVQLAINAEKETIELAGASSSAVGDFTKVIPDDAPRYSFFVFHHDHEGNQESPLVFIYTCPSQSKIKERMLYASCRSSIVETAVKDVGLTINKKLEAASANDIGEAQLLEEFHPKQEAKAAFQRPKRPGRR